jgi:hypothetical protein
LNVNLKGYEGTTQIGVYSISGLLIQSKTTNKLTELLDVNALPSGIYMLKVTNGKKKTITSKFTKN